LPGCERHEQFHATEYAPCRDADDTNNPPFAFGNHPEQEWRYEHEDGVAGKEVGPTVRISCRQQVDDEALDRLVPHRQRYLVFGQQQRPGDVKQGEADAEQVEHAGTLPELLDDLAGIGKNLRAVQIADQQTGDNKKPFSR